MTGNLNTNPSLIVIGQTNIQTLVGLHRELSRQIVCRYLIEPTHPDSRSLIKTEKMLDSVILR